MLAFLILSVDHFEESKALQKHYSETRGSFLFLNAGFKLVDRKAHFDQENA